MSSPMSPWALTMAMIAMANCMPAQEMSHAEDPEETGKTMLSRTPFPAPDGTVKLELPNGSFEEIAANRPAGWSQFRGMSLLDEDSPTGQRHVAFPGGTGSYWLAISDVPVTGNRPHLLSLQARTTARVPLEIFYQDAAGHWGSRDWLSLPNTNGEWRHVGLYFRPAHGATMATIEIRRRRPGEVAAFALDDLAMRTATEDEYLAAYLHDRRRFPARDLSPRPTDGHNMALTVRKLEQGMEPPRPLLIWAIGSSYTNMLGMGETVRQIILQRFGTDREVVYRKHVGSAVPWQYIRGWYHHQVMLDQPDVIQIYTIGKPEDLEKLIADIRRTSTADIIVPSIHWRIRDTKNWGVSENAADQDVAKIRDICRRHGVEFVENRREWAEFMTEHNMTVKVDPAGLLKDAVHQSDYGAMIINENIARHFARPEQFAYQPDERERRLILASPKSIRPAENVTLAGAWQQHDNLLTTSSPDDSITIAFQGNRIDLIGVKTGPDGGSVKILIDGQPADQAPAFLRTPVIPGPKNNRPAKGLTGDRAPHGVLLGQNIVPQDWTIRMINGEGGYEIVGSITGKDGEGAVFNDFTSASGQITVPAEWWRSAFSQARDGTKTFNNLKDDVFTFSVLRATNHTVTFQGPAHTRFRMPLAQNLDNRTHTVTIIAQGDGPVTLAAVDIFEPPLK